MLAQYYHSETFVCKLEYFSDKITGLGNKLLVYISCCLAGVAYPHGTMDPETSELVKQEVCCEQSNFFVSSLESYYG